jgi:hypothetical protein
MDMEKGEEKEEEIKEVKGEKNLAQLKLTSHLLAIALCPLLLFPRYSSVEVSGAYYINARCISCLHCWVASAHAYELSYTFAVVRSFASYSSLPLFTLDL